MKNTESESALDAGDIAKPEAASAETEQSSSSTSFEISTTALILIPLIIYLPEIITAVRWW